MIRSGKVILNIDAMKNEEKKNGIVSVVLPAYNEEKMIEKAYETIRGILKNAKIEYELVFVDDGSLDLTWEKMEGIAQKDQRVVGIHFSRNFGKEAAIFAGMAQASGDAVAVMDCDLQHPPKLLLEMYELWQSGFEVIEGIKSYRGKESGFHKKSANLFNKIMSKITGINMQNASDYKMMDKKVVDSILAMPEKNMFFRATSMWVGFKRTQVAFEVQEREAGESKWNTAALIKYAFNNVVAFTTVPMQFVTVAGGMCFLCSILLLIYSLAQYFLGNAVEGYTTLLIVMLFIGSAVMLSLGVIGYYISKIYEEVKQRPRYIVSKIVRG